MMKIPILSGYPMIEFYYFSNAEGEVSKTLRANEFSKIRVLNERNPGSQMYFGGHLHDSWVKNARLKNSKFMISLNEFQSHCFFEAFCEFLSLKIPHRVVDPRLEVIFNGVKKLDLFSFSNENQFFIESEFSILNNDPYEG